MNEENSPSPSIESPQLPVVQKKSSWKSVFKEIFIFAIIAFGIVYPFRKYVAEPYIVSGASMDPTFATGDYLIVDKLSYETGKPQRNSVVVFRYPGNPAIGRTDATPAKNFIKRIIGLPGETVTMKDNAVTIKNTDNPKGFALDQSYVVHPCPKNTSCVSSFEIKLGADEYFVMGDNRAESYDSRSWGPVPKANIIGTPVLQLFPLNKVGFIPGADNKK